MAACLPTKTFLSQRTLAVSPRSRDSLAANHSAPGSTPLVSTNRKWSGRNAGPFFVLVAGPCQSKRSPAELDSPHDQAHQTQDLPMVPRKHG